MCLAAHVNAAMAIDRLLCIKIEVTYFFEGKAKVTDSLSSFESRKVKHVLFICLGSR